MQSHLHLGSKLLMKRILFSSAVILLLVSGVFAQTFVEISDDDGIPPLIKDLPDWETVFENAKVAGDSETLKRILGPRDVIDLIDFTGGTETATAPYDAGKLLIVEYPTPQASSAADALFQEKLGSAPSMPPAFYRRIGNFNVFVFDASDEAAANALLDKIKYEKTVQWLGKDPNYLQKAERYLARSTADMFLSTAKFIVLGLGSAALLGIVAGLAFFRFREQRRAAMSAFSDAGGMIRLNLDELSEPITSGRLLNE